MQLAIQEDMLAGRTVLEKLEQAAQLGFEGVEFWAEGLTERVPEIVGALAATGLKASAVNQGRRDGYLSPDLAEREAAISQLRQTMADAVDIGAYHVLFVPLYGASKMPDLTPYRSPIELEGEMLVWLLRTVSDLAYAMGVELDMQPANRYETYFLNRLEQGAFFRRKIKDHPHVKIAAGLFHMAMEEDDALGSLREYGSHLGYIHVSDHNGRLPGQGMLDFTLVIRVLREIGYDGWLSYACGETGQNQRNANRFMAELPASIHLLREAGI